VEDYLTTLPPLKLEAIDRAIKFAVELL